jgi:hypothetical protein
MDTTMDVEVDVRMNAVVDVTMNTMLYAVVLYTYTLE